MATVDKAGKDTDKEKSVDKSKSYESGGTAFVGCIILGTGIGQFSTYLITIVPSLLFRCDFYGRRHPPFAAGGRRGKYAIMSE